MTTYRVAGTFIGQPGPTRIEPDAAGLFIDLPEAEWPVAVGDTIEDCRPPLWGGDDDDNPQEIHPGFPGKVMRVTSDCFYVLWNDSTTHIGYAWAFLGHGLYKREIVLGK